VIYVCENNQYAISVAQCRSCSVPDIYVRKEAYGIQGGVVDGNDVMAVYEAAKEAVARARRGEGPTLIECKTYRWRGHYEGEADRTYSYRPKQEIEEWMERCPIRRFQKVLLSKEILSQDDLKEVEQEIQKDLEAAVQFAQNCPWPQPQDALKDLYYEE
jgi:TPP-dependent pyruvate/acetoin dehydrogenase alpha subunit